MLKIKVYKKNGKKSEVKNIIKLKEWAREEDSVVVVIYQDKKEDSIKEEKSNRKLRELQISMLFNPRYQEEKENYKIKLDALRSYYKFLTWLNQLL